MAYQGHGHKLVGVEAGADLSTNQYHACKLDGAGQVVLAGAGDHRSAALAIHESIQAVNVGDYFLLVVWHALPPMTASCLPKSS